MTQATQDIWSQWLLHRRHGDDPQYLQTQLEALYLVREKVLHHANLADGERLLDVGCGDGLIAFGALAQSKTSQVIFSDISQDLLDTARAIAQENNLLARCQFLPASADDLSALGEAAVDVITTRSVLIYVSAKQTAFREFYRLLKPGGRLSIFEPINRFAYPEADHIFWGYDVTPVLALARKVKDLYDAIQPTTDPMLDFDERDLIVLAQQAGFDEVHLNLETKIKPSASETGWETFLRTAGNPKIPTVGEAIAQALTPAEAKEFRAYLRPLVETQQRLDKSAVVYLWAVKY